MKKQVPAIRKISTPTRWRRLTGYGAAGVTLAVFWILMVAGAANKCTTSDEIVHAAGGYAYWHFNDYRMNPENGNLPQRLAGLGMMVGNYRFPSLDQPAWRGSEEWLIGYQFFYDPELGNNVWWLLLHGRMAMALLAVSLGLLIYVWSRELFGPSGGMISLLLYVLCPIALANGPLIASDMAGGLFFLLSLWFFWKVLQRVTPVGILASGLAVAGLFLSKMSGILIIPLAAALIVLRLVAGEPLEVHLLHRRVLKSRWQQAWAFTVVTAVHIAIIFAVIWASFGFRYEMMAGGVTGRDHPEVKWETLLEEPGAIQISISFARAHHLLPEAFLYGYAHTFKFSEGRPAFLNGECKINGWRLFFPYTFLVKTPFTIFVIVILAAVAAVLWLRKNGESSRNMLRAAGSALYRTAPLWLLFFAYWAAVIPSHMNIGHRHILPVYPPMLVLAGAGAYWFQAECRFRWMRYGIVASIALLAAEVLSITPNFLTYFNQIIGGPRNGWKHLVDSSLDWGQDLPALKSYLEKDDLGQSGKPAYLAYFGNGSPFYYGIPARLLWQWMEWDLQARPDIRRVNISSPLSAEQVQLAIGTEFPEYCLLKPLNLAGNQEVWLIKKPETYEIAGGTFCISATILQPVLDSSAMGPWNDIYEICYRELGELVMPLIAAPNLERRESAFRMAPPNAWPYLLKVFREFRFARFAAYLRQREPDDTVNYSILIHRLTDQEASKALEGPLPMRAPSAEQERSVLDIGNSLATMGKTLEAIKLYEGMLRVDPNYPDAHNSLGAALASQGKLPEAAVCFRKALALAPGSEDARKNLAKVQSQIH
jgi:tetratricopeptide (TPR) repeat protein